MAMSCPPHHHLRSSFSTVPYPLNRTTPSSRKQNPTKPHHQPIISARNDSRPLRAAVIGGGPAGSSAAEALAVGGVETYLLERSPTGSKPCGGAIPICMLEEFSIPDELIDRRVTQMRIISPSNLHADFGKSLRPGEHIPMLRREVLDAFLRRRAESSGAHLIAGLFTALEIPSSPSDPYVVRYAKDGCFKNIAVDVVVGADGANSRVAKEIDAGPYAQAIAFQERIRLPPAKMERYADLAEMYVGGDVSPDFYGWVFPKCDHVAVGTGTTVARSEIKKFQAGIRARAGGKIAGGEVIRVEELKREYLRKWDGEYLGMFRFLDLLQRVFYGSNAGREALVDMCGDEYVQRMTFDSYFYKKMVAGDPWKDAGLLWKTVSSLVRAGIVGREVERLKDMGIGRRDPLFSYTE